MGILLGVLVILLVLQVNLILLPLVIASFTIVFRFLRNRTQRLSAVTLNKLGWLKP